MKNKSSRKDKAMRFKIIAFIGIIAGAFLCNGRAETINGQSSWGDTVKWGGSVDSNSRIIARGNAIRRDSASTWVVITTDSCSKWVTFEKNGQRPIWKTAEVQYEVRTSSGNTDSSRVLLNIDSRYCRDLSRGLKCDSIVRAGRHSDYPDVTVKDTVITQSTTSGVTWLATQQAFNVPHGNQHRICIDSYEAGGATGDTTFFRNFILRYQ